MDGEGGKKEENKSRAKAERWEQARVFQKKLVIWCGQNTLGLDRYEVGAQDNESMCGMRPGQELTLLRRPDLQVTTFILASK